MSQDLEKKVWPVKKLRGYASAIISATVPGQHVWVCPGPWPDSKSGCSNTDEDTRSSMVMLRFMSARDCHWGWHSPVSRKIIMQCVVIKKALVSPLTGSELFKIASCREFQHPVAVWLLRQASRIWTKVLTFGDTWFRVNHWANCALA